MAAERTGARVPRAPAATVWVLGSLLAGVLQALQSRMNGALAQRLGQPVQASLWSFGSGLVVALALMVLPAHRRGLARLVMALRQRLLPWWMLLAGVIGGAFVGIQAAVVPLIGVALFSVAVIAGQTVGGLLVDASGLGPGAAQRVTATRAAAGALALAGVVLAASAGARLAAVVPALVVVVLGLVTTIQTAWNGRITQTSGGMPLVATAINFVAGTSALTCYAVVLLATGRFRPVPLRGPWWIWWGGVCGLVFVSIASMAIRHIGVLMFTLVTLVTQLLTALLLDVATPGLHHAADPARLAGIAVTAVAAGSAGWAARSARS